MAIHVGNERAGWRGLLAAMGLLCFAAAAAGVDELVLIFCAGLLLALLEWA
jgi:chromate transport protein ChrA